MRDMSFEHPTVKMDGDQPCGTCKHAQFLGWCDLHKVDVGFLDGCKSHERQDFPEKKDN